MAEYRFTQPTITKSASTTTIVKPSTNKMCILPEETIELLNYRINQEELSSRIYLAMSLWLEDRAYFNSAKLWKKYSDEELGHAEWARDFLLAYNHKPCTDPIGVVPNEFNGLDDIINQTLQHETLITNQCKELLKHALEVELLVMPLAEKYVREQAEEMQKAYDLVTLLNNYGVGQLNLALLDHEIERFL
jgi:ferritin